MAPAAASVARAAPVSGDFAGLFARARADAGLPAATSDPRLARAAQAHAEDMVRQGYFSHVGLNGSQVMDRVLAQGYATCEVSENIAGGQQDEAAAFVSWMESPGHRRNMLMRGAAQYGLGRAGDRWVLVMAKPC